MAFFQGRPTTVITVSFTEFWPFYEFESILNRISVPTVEKGYEFFAWTFVFHMDMGINKELLSVLTDNLKLNWSWKLKSMDKKNRFWRNMNESPQWNQTVVTIPFLKYHEMTNLK